MHTFLFEPGRWAARGVFFDANGVGREATGQVNITHDQVWRNSGTMTLQGDPAVTVENTYEISPFPAQGDTTRWTSNHPTVGKLRGTLTRVADALVSASASSDGNYRGQEVMLRISATEYRAVGAFYEGERKLSSWSVTLTRE